MRISQFTPNKCMQYFIPFNYLTTYLTLHTHQYGISDSALLTSQLSAYKTTLSAMFSSNKRLQHNSHSNMPHRLSTVHALLHVRWTISAMLSRNEVAATHNITHSPCTATPTTHLELHTPHAFHVQDNHPVHTSNKHKAQLAKCHKM